ncbi:hypothetical protein VitviT2T_021812 [Vitis vinifera]|uniref:Uncharacterized protein n=1 Tax=Vitis vinifera TaxID=29760 RepID=A0ABY9DAX4_VITVI|nr:hypothetical protein VitviT2T_021812 [Vitis vinifera]
MRERILQGVGWLLVVVSGDMFGLDYMLNFIVFLDHLFVVVVDLVVILMVYVRNLKLIQPMLLSISHCHCYCLCFDEKVPGASEKRVINSVLVAILERHVPTVTSLAMSGDGKTLLSAEKGKVVD